MQSRAQREAVEKAAEIRDQSTGVPLGAEDIFVEGEDGTLITWADRKGFGVSIQKLAYESRPGYHRHWFNDEPGRIAQARAAGYTPVKDKLGKAVSMVVDKATGVVAYLHEVPQAWYESDIAVGQRAADEMDAAILAGNARDPSGATAGLRPDTTYGKVKVGRGR